MKKIRRFLSKKSAFLALLTVFVATVSWAREVPKDLTELPVEDLMKIEVTSVSKKAQKLSDAAAAIFVITQEDIRRSGVTSIPEALRMVPGIEVARIDTSRWAVSSRGFNGLFANKLLVLIDGRSVYTPLYSGVFWNLQDMLLEDIDRIEVIRGPGASLWGANAVNGVINILTKQAEETQGGLVAAGGGTGERVFGAVRYGTSLGKEAHLRGYVKGFKKDESVFTDGSRAADDWDALHGGFRLDWHVTEKDFATVQGDLFGDNSGLTWFYPSLSPPYSLRLDDRSRFNTGNILGRWTHSFSKSSEGVLQLYYDYADEKELQSKEVRQTFDMDMQHRFGFTDRQEVVWGLGYRFTQNRFENNSTFAYHPESRGIQLLGAFVQDDITLIHGNLHLIVGSKFEFNDFTGFEIQPTARVLWTPAPQHTFWSAVSRAVRTPSRSDEDVRFNTAVIPPGTPGNPSPLPVQVAIFGNRGIKSEEVIAYEFGYRFHASPRLSVDLAAYYNDYRNLVTYDPKNPYIEAFPLPAHLVQPLQGANKMKGSSYGVELALDWRPVEKLRFQAAYTYLETRLHSNIEGDPTVQRVEGSSPHHQFSLRSSIDLPWNLELDGWFRCVGKLSAIDVDGYATLDARLAWKPWKNLELSVVGQNLLQRHHLEFRPDFINAPSTEGERGIFGKITWKF